MSLVWTFPIILCSLATSQRESSAYRASAHLSLCPHSRPHSFPRNPSFVRATARARLCICACSSPVSPPPLGDHFPSTRPTTRRRGCSVWHSLALQGLACLGQRRRRREESVARKHERAAGAAGFGMLRMLGFSAITGGLHLAYRGRGVSAVAPMMAELLPWLVRDRR